MGQELKTKQNISHAKNDGVRVVFIGGGGHCKSVLDTALRTRVLREIVIVDPEIPAGTIINGCKVLGDDSLLHGLYVDGFRHAIITVGSIKETSLRRRLVNTATNYGFEFVSIIDPSAMVSESAHIGKGVFIGKNAVINASTVIEDHAIINTGALIEHDCHIGVFSHIAVRAVVCGGADINEDTFIGANTTVVQGIRVGAGTVIGAGSVVAKDIPDHCFAIGVPAKAVN